MGPDDKAVEDSNQQGYDETCGTRTPVMASVKAGYEPADTAADKALVDDLWVNTLHRSLASEWTTGMTLDDQYQVIWALTAKLGKRIELCPLRVSEIQGTEHGAADLRSTVFPDGNGVAIQFKTIAVDLGDVIGENLRGAYHFLLIVVAESTVDDRVLDSCQHVDFGSDHYTDAQLIAGARSLFQNATDNIQIGWAWTWSDAT